jgi:hypothetical protein
MKQVRRFRREQFVELCDGHADRLRVRFAGRFGDSGVTSGAESPPAVHRLMPRSTRPSTPLRQPAMATEPPLRSPAAVQPVLTDGRGRLSVSALQDIARYAVSLGLPAAPHPGRGATD